MTTDPWDDPQMKEWADHVRREAAPKILKSKVTISLVPTDPRLTDIKFAVELGLSIMYDKPIVAVVTPGMQVPDHLVRVADRIIEWEPGRADLSDALAREIKEVISDA